MKVNEIIVSKLLEKMEAGLAPWKKSWKGGGEARNFETGHEYRGVNKLLTSFNKTPYYLSFKQINDRGGKIKKGEKGTMLVFWKMSKVGNEGDEKTIPFMRYYLAWDISQIENLDPEYVEKRKNKYEGQNPFTPIERAETIINGMPTPPKVEHMVGNNPCYQPTKDKVLMPERESFDSEDEYYCTMFHELSHSTGHSSRLNRLTKTTDYGANTYSEEELVAEIAASFLQNESGILESTLNNSAAYIKSWADAIKNSDKKSLLITASQKAQKAVDYILNKKFETAPQTEE